MADIALPKKAPPVASAAPPLFDLSPMIRFIHHIALGFPTIGFGGELAAGRGSRLREFIMIILRIARR